MKVPGHGLSKRFDKYHGLIDSYTEAELAERGPDMKVDVLTNSCARLHIRTRSVIRQFNPCTRTPTYAGAAS